MKTLSIPAAPQSCKRGRATSISSAAQRIATAVAIVATLTAWFTAAACDLETSRPAQFITAAACLLAAVSAFAAAPRQKGGVQ